MPLSETISGNKLLGVENILEKFNVYRSKLASITTNSAAVMAMLTRDFLGNLIPW